MNAVSGKSLRRALLAAFTLPLLLTAVLAPIARAQRAASLQGTRTLYVENFSGGPAAAQLRDSIMRHLERSRRFRLVSSAADADAVLHGTGEVWVRGHISINPRTPSSDRRAVFSGYLSLVVDGADNQPLWSWLVTPSRLTWTDIVNDLAGQATQKLVGDANTSPAAVPVAAAALVQTSLDGAGATFPAPLYQKWFEDFGALHPGVHIRYSANGSQLGVERLLADQIDFAGSDVAPQVIVSASASSHFHRIASVLGAVVPIYHLDGITQDLRFTPEALADIYLGKVRRWNDPEIQRSNRGVPLPAAAIAVVHRSDGSGTAWVWSDFLSRVSPAWTANVGRGTTLHWPVGSGAERNEGVAETVSRTPNSIGYVELAYAIQRELSYGSVRNRSGEFIHADLESVAEAVRSSRINGEPPPSITDPPGKYAYPIAAFTWLLLPGQSQNSVKKAALTELLRWVLTTGQKECSALGYMPLPRDLAESELRLLDATP